MKKKNILILFLLLFSLLSGCASIHENFSNADTAASTPAVSTSPSVFPTAAPPTTVLPTTVPPTTVPPTTVPPTTVPPTTVPPTTVPPTTVPPTTVPPTTVPPTTVPPTTVPPTTVPPTTVPPTTAPVITPTSPPATESPADEILFIHWPETISRNETAEVTIQGKSNTEYSITVYYKSGPSTAKGLEAKTSDSNGYVTWTWKVGGKTSPGTFRIVVSGGGTQNTVNFTVIS